MIVILVWRALGSLRSPARDFRLQTVYSPGKIARKLAVVRHAGSCSTIGVRNGFFITGPCSKHRCLPAYHPEPATPAATCVQGCHVPATPRRYDLAPTNPRIPSPEGACTEIVYTLATKCLNKDYFKAKVYTIWAHGPLGQ